MTSYGKDLFVDNLTVETINGEPYSADGGMNELTVTDGTTVAPSANFAANDTNFFINLPAPVVTPPATGETQTITIDHRPCP